MEEVDHSSAQSTTSFTFSSTVSYVCLSTAQMLCHFDSRHRPAMHLPVSGKIPPPFKQPKHQLLFLSAWLFPALPTSEHPAPAQKEYSRFSLSCFVPSETHFGLVVRPVRSHRVPSSGERRSGLSDSLLVDPPNSTESHCASSEERKKGRVTGTGARGLQRDAAFRVVPEMGPSQC